MKKLLVICLLLAVIPFTVYAGPCGDFEYAELMDMDQTTLLKEYCEAKKTGKVYIEVYMYAPNRDKFRYKSDADSCMDIIGKMERIYMKRFNVENQAAMKDVCK